MFYKLVAIFSITALCLCSCNDSKDQSIISIEIHPDITHQTMDNFGASDCWSCQYIGKNWDDEKKNQIAEWLFSNEVDANGQPKGIALSAWRFNIGAGSAEQGKESEIPQVWRRSECFLNTDGSYNWHKQEGQRWFLQQAKDYGVAQFLAFAISPPVSMTVDGKAHGGGRQTYSLQESKYTDFAQFLTKVMVHFRDRQGISFDYISPENEPQWDWGKSISQEGTACTNNEYARIVREMDKTFVAQNVKTKIQLSECAQIDYLYSDSTDLIERDNQLDDFFTPHSSNYIGNLASIVPTFTAHSYFTTWPVEQMINKRRLLKNKLDEIGTLNYWQSEYCVLENNKEIKGKGRDLGMNTALYVARVMHHDLTLTDASAWQWWLAVSPHDYKDGLVYTDNDTLNGDIYDSKLLWAFGNYSRFVRPGMQRIDVTTSSSSTVEEQANDLMVSAYTDNDKVVLVAINYTENNKTLLIKDKEKCFTPYITSTKKNDNIRPLPSVSNEAFVMPARSVVTFVSK